MDGIVCIAAHARMWFTYVPYVHIPGVHGRFYGLQLKKGNGCLENKLWRPLDCFDEENDCRFEVQREEHWIHTRPTWSMAVRERLQELFCD